MRQYCCPNLKVEEILVVLNFQSFFNEGFKLLLLSHVRGGFAHFTFLPQVSRNNYVRWGKMTLAWLDQIPAKCVDGIGLFAIPAGQSSGLC